ncbi:sodium stibogluconate resistance protein [Trypanosoma rangeli]|uniref:Sodium stibogluconate resistance protein n=1 Tax=Trypanosoma rangeli TaxID=5698 RepID=A0A422NBD1_TRYRA|nr:sodium stibogluconate resistance protein [Trypanosoma rangeli]RNF02773.1 sodium stibogluconate resistance protein [Trypanosoma rangeli]|eukprot:RNF02773.1 sodium stibogluconate resistance protein [Trypanosoma rangeli]
MGTGASAINSCHSRLYQEGYKSLLEGRYTYAEIYYDQAIEKHEGHYFWTSLGGLIDWERRRKHTLGQNKSDTKQRKELPQDEVTEEGAYPEVVKKADDDNELDVEMEEAGASEPRGIEIPLDSRLEAILEYIQLRSDIVDSYLMASRYEEAAAHLDVIISHTRVFVQFLRYARETEVEVSSEDNTTNNPLEMGAGVGGAANGGGENIRLRLNALIGNDLERESILDCLEQYLRLHWASAMANSVYASSERFKEGKGEKKRKKDLDAAVLACSKVHQELYNVALRRAKSLTNTVVLNFIEAAMEDMDAESTTTSITSENYTNSKGKPRVNTFFDNSDNKQIQNKNNGILDLVMKRGEECPIKVSLQKMHERRSLCREVPAPQQASTLRYISWIDDDIRRVVPSTNYHLEIQCGMVDEKQKKQLQKRSLKFVAQKHCNYNDRVLLGKSFDEENALLLFPVFLIQADVQFQLGAATKGIKNLELVEKLSTQLYGIDSVERQSIMRSVMESRKRGGSLFMMFED